MCRISNAVVAGLNVMFFILGVALLGFGVYYHVHAATSACQHFLQNSLLILGAIVTVLSLLGLIGSCRHNVLLCLYLFLMFLLIVAVAVLAGFVFLVTNDSVGRVVSRKGVSDYRLGDYSHWLQNHFAKGKNWDVFRSCLVDAHACKAFTNAVGPINATDLFQHNFAPIESGCCKPPSDCGFEYINTTFWTDTSSSETSSNNIDCGRWSNNQNELCYNCNSCKAGFLAKIRSQWRELAIFFVVLLIFMILLFSFGCCARKNNRHDHRPPQETKARTNI